MADVGNVDVQGEISIRQRIDPDGVVEIARGFAVNRYYVHAAKIAAALRLRVRNGDEYILRLLHRIWREAMRQVVLANHNLDIHAEVVGTAEDFDHTPDG